MARGLEGTIIARRYELLSLLGRGSYASVWKARQLDVGGEVAVKVLAPGYADDPALIEDFIAQAKAYVPFRDNPRIATILDCGQDLDTGYTYVAMSLLEETVEGIVREVGPLSPERVFRLAEDIGSALRTIHRVGLVHRDVKTTNIMTVPGDDRFVLTDFAVGLLEDLADQTAPTVDMTRVGNWAYASPERIHATRRSEIGPSSDIYSLGVVLFRAATGQFPFSAPFPQIISDQLKKEPPDPKALRPDIPRGLADVILRCLRKVPEDRFHSADDFLEGLRLARASTVRKVPIDLKSRRVVLGAAAVAALGIITLAILAFLPKGLAIDVRSQPPGASFRLFEGQAAARFDAKSTGVTPKRVKGLGERTYTVVVEKDGFFPKEVTFQPSRLHSELETIVLERRVRLRVMSDPPGAIAEVRQLGTDEGVEGGRTPADFTGLRAGPHELVLRLENYATLVDTILVGRDDGQITRRLNPGSLVALEVMTEPPGARIVLTRLDRGDASGLDRADVAEPTNCRIPNLEPGRYSVRLELARFETVDTTLALLAGDPVAQLAVALRPSKPTTPAEDGDDDTADRLTDRPLGPGDREVTSDDREAKEDAQVKAETKPEPEKKKPADPGVVAAESPKILQTLRQYEQALEERDVKSFARLWVALPPKELKDFESSLREVRSQKIEITENGIELVDNQATIRFREKRSIEPVSGKGTNSDRNRVMTLRRIGGDWLIQSVR